MPTALPPISSFTGAGITEGDFKAALTDLRAFLAGLLGTDGGQATALAALGALLGAGSQAKSGAYTVVPTDRGTALWCSGTWTLALPAAATAADGFALAVRNTGSGTITVDPDAAETIDGAATIALAAGESALLVCDGATWRTFARKAAITSGDISGALGYTPANPASFVDNDVGYNTVGSFRIGPGSVSGGNSATRTLGGTYSGSTLGFSTGTWRCLGQVGMSSMDSSTGYYTAYMQLFQRIA